jgi:hypothetical protein
MRHEIGNQGRKKLGIKQQDSPFIYFFGNLESIKIGKRK